LQYYQAVSGGLLACLALQLKLRGKSTTQSHRSAIYYVDLTVRDGLTLEEAISAARITAQQREEMGFKQTALDEAARQGFANAAFEFSEEEIPELLEEFYPNSQEDDGAKESEAAQAASPPLLNQNHNGKSQKPTLRTKLDQRLQAVGG
ncbi:MAG: hydrolase or metal-binding protein, partial [Pseudomonadales bacterium]|nr:hydrolase or metal-binding protein [Pseudomonadales bacterium]